MFKITEKWWATIWSEFAFTKRMSSTIHFNSKRPKKQKKEEKGDCLKTVKLHVQKSQKLKCRVIAIVTKTITFKWVWFSFVQKGIEWQEHPQMR